MRRVTSVQDSFNQGQVDRIEFVTVLINPPSGFPGGVNYDVPIRFQSPRHVIGVSSFATTYSSSSVFVHLNPTFRNNQTGSNLIFTDGGENWIPLRHSASDPAGNKPTAEGRIVVFKTPVQNLFISVDHPAGGVLPPGFPITLFGADSIDDVVIERVG